MAKRIFDIAASLFGLVFLSPLLLLIALAVKCSTPGPVLYSHIRVGLNGTSFGCLKFRTMYDDADRKLQLLLTDPKFMDEWKKFYKLKFDPRITPMGKWLRKTSLDELPQLFNVLKGDMSVVGPRPLTKHEVTDYLKEKASTILSVKPGLTTLWIVQGRNLLTLEERIALEEVYVNTRSFWLDLRVICKTAWSLIFPKGAY
jgi:undecaprenyl-phosphate galactose phosphotransferase